MCHYYTYSLSFINIIISRPNVSLLSSCVRVLKTSLVFILYKYRRRIRIIAHIGIRVYNIIQTI